jgi:uncharacterized protein YcbK (DUF882 family)
MDMMPRTRADAMAIASLAVVLAAVISAKVMQALPAVPADEPIEAQALPAVPADEPIEAQALPAVPAEERIEALATITVALPAPTMSLEIEADQAATQIDSDRLGIFARYQQSLIRPAHDRVVMQYMPALLRAVLDRAAAHFSAPVLVTSAYRSPGYNRKVRGAWRSMHMVRDGKRGAVDFKVMGVSKGTLYAWAKRQPEVAGIGLYCRSDFIHVDNGNKRSWYWGCGGRRRYAKGSRRIQMAGAAAGSHDSH